MVPDYLNQTWNRDHWLPAPIDTQLQQISQLRDSWRQMNSVYPDTRVVDQAVGFYSVGELLRYIPRAIEIVLFSPFPNDWLNSQLNGHTSAFRIAAIPETLANYALLLFLFFFGLRALARRNFSIYLAAILIFSGLLLLPLGLAINGLGSLHRLRYSFLSLLTGAGVCLVVEAILSVRRSAASAIPNSERLT